MLDLPNAAPPRHGEDWTQILPKDDLVLAVTMPTETRLELEDLKAPSWSSWSRGIAPHTDARVG